MALVEEAHKAARLLLDHGYVRLVARAEPDAVCAAGLLGHALRRENVDFHVTWVGRLDAPALARLREERNDALVLMGLSGDAETEDAPAARKVVLDAGPSTLLGEAVLEPGGASARAPGHASLASLAYLVGVGMSKRNRDLAPLALAGALAGWRHLGGLRGLDAEVRAEALEHGALVEEPGLALHGSTLQGALAHLDAPYVAGVTGRARHVKKLVDELGLPGDAPPGAVTGQDAERLGSVLALRLLQQRAPDAAFDALFRPRMRSLQGPHTGTEAGELARLVEAGCALGRCGLAFGALWPDAQATSELHELAARAREEMVAALLRAEREARHEGKLVVADAPSAALCRPFAERLAASLVPAGRVAVALHVEGDDATLFARTLDRDADLLAAARHAAAEAGGRAAGGPSEAHLRAPAAEAGRIVKALAEALA